jgi:hypothetical protein
MYLKEKEKAIQEKDFVKLNELIETDTYWTTRIIENGDNYVDKLDCYSRYMRENGILIGKACKILSELCLQRAKE